MIVVTGGAGFIGSAFVAKLNEEGRDDIVIVDDLGTTDKWKNLVKRRYDDYLDKGEFLSLIEQNRVGFFRRGRCPFGGLLPRRRNGTPPT